MTTPFLDLPKTGKADSWRYGLGLFVIFFCWFILGGLPFQLLITFIKLDSNPNTSIDPISGFPVGIHPLLNFLLLNMSFWMLWLGLFLAMRFIHQRPFLTLVTPLQNISWSRLLQGFGVFILLSAIASGVEYLLTPENFILSLNTSAFLPFFWAMIVLIPIQTSAEELLFRGYLLQATGQANHNYWLLAIINGVLFMVPHLGNPEVADSPILLALIFFTIGAFLTWVTLKDNRLELALGAHAANNLFAGVFINYTNSVLQTESIFLLTELNAVYSLGALLLMSFIFYGWFFLRV